MENFEIGIIGAGPAGYTAALHAASNGRSVVLFEKDEIGGVCLNRGCIPTKTILHSSEIFAQISKSENLGIVANDVQLDFSKVIEHKNQVIEKLRKGIELALKIAKVTVVNAEAKILSDKEILANDTTYICDKIICATGSSPKVLKGLEFNGEFLISSDEILNLKELPKNILIVGSGAIGLEWAGIMSNFGVETSILEAAPHLLPIADIEVSKRIERIFKTRKINFFTNDYTLIFDTDVEEKIVRCGKTEIERCIINLVGNAVKFTPKGGLIEVTIKDLDDKVQISVKDNGIGISEENKKLIFDRFNQVVDENSEVKGGSGLGLTISKQLITLHGGHIYVESEVGIGSEFIIILPANNY